MENKKIKKNAPEELDDNILDYVSGGKDEFIPSEEVIVTCSTCNKPFTVLVSKLWRSDECPTCKALKNKI